MHVYPDSSWELVILDLEYGGTLDDLLNRKARFTAQQVDSQLRLEFQGKTLDNLNPQEKRELIYHINRRTVKTAFYTLQSAVTKLSQ